MKTVVIVTGGRDYYDAASLTRILDSINLWHGPLRLIEGDCPTGADAGARWWRIMRGVEGRSYPADWDRHGKAAGPIRNGTMLREEPPALVVAFPGGRGTADMVERARRADVKIAEVCDGAGIPNPDG